MSQTRLGETGAEEPLYHAKDESGPRSKFIGHYVLGKTIGEGTFGKVKQGTHVLTGQRVAVKVLEKERIVEIADVERVAREVHILKLIRHPHIVQLYEIIETKRQLYLIMEYAAGGELFDYIVTLGRVQEPEACRLFHQIVSGIEKIHDMNIVHRDLKPENLLLDHNSSVKIVDFGLSNVFREGQLLRTACGSPCYAPPEMISGNPYLPRGCDLWSVGVILFAIVCGYLPFEDPCTAELYRTILSGDYLCPDFLSEPVKDLIGGLLTTDPARRFTVNEVRAHPWYRQIPEASLPVEWLPGVREPEGDLLQDLEAFGFPRDYALRCLELNKHNHVTTTYYLLAERRRRKKGALDYQTGCAPVANSLGGTDPFNLIGLEGVESSKGDQAAPLRAARMAGWPADQFSGAAAEWKEAGDKATQSKLSPPLPTDCAPAGSPTPMPLVTSTTLPPGCSTGGSLRTQTPVRSAPQVSERHPRGNEGHAGSTTVGSSRSPPRGPLQMNVSPTPRPWSPGATAFSSDAARRIPAIQQHSPAWPTTNSYQPARATPSSYAPPGPRVSETPRAWSPVTARASASRCDGHSPRTSLAGSGGLFRPSSPEPGLRSGTPRAVSPSPAGSVSPRDPSPVALARSVAVPAAAPMAAYLGGASAQSSGGSPPAAHPSLQQPMAGWQQPQQSPCGGGSLLSSLIGATPRYVGGGHQTSRACRTEFGRAHVPHTPRAGGVGGAHASGASWTVQAASLPCGDPGGAPATSRGCYAAQGFLDGAQSRAGVQKFPGSPVTGRVTSARAGPPFSVSPRGSGGSPASARALSQGAAARAAAAWTSRSPHAGRHATRAVQAEP